MNTARRDAPVLRSIAALAAPIVVANAVHTSHQLVNTLWVGRLGADAVAAVSVSFPILFLVMSIGGGASIAGAVLAAQYVGAGDTRAVRRVAGQTLVLSAALSLLVAAAGVLLAPALLRIAHTDPAVHDAALAYLRISFLGAPFGFAFATYQALSRATGDARTPLKLVSASVALNVLLDPLLIFGAGPVPALGVAGAAWATLLAQAAVTAPGLAALANTRRGPGLRADDLRPDRTLLLRLARLGLPASVEQAMQALSISAITLLVSGFGTLAIAAYGIGMRVLTFAIIPAFGISMAASVLVGQSLGAGERYRAERITRASALLGIGVLGTAGAAIALAATPIVRAFAPGDPALVEAGSTALRWIAPAFGLMGLQLSLAGTFRGAGDTFAAMLLSVIGTWGVQLPIAWLLSDRAGLGETGIWMTYLASGVVNALIALAYLRWGRWRHLLPAAGAGAAR